jgi:hypothetical protein
MEFLRSWKFMAIIFGVLAVVAIAGVIFGVTTHTEPGLDAREPWSHTPLRVCPGGYLPSEYDARTADRVSAAVSITNTRLGFEMLQIAEAFCDITVMVDGAVDVGGDGMEPGGDATFYEGRCEIRTGATGTLELTGLVIQHELGHCMGLEHDSWVGSIMRPVQVPTPLGEFPPHITDFDRELLRGLYGPR